MKQIITLICICFIIGLIEHVQEVSAHKTLEIENEGEAENSSLDDFNGSDGHSGGTGGDAQIIDEDSEQSVQNKMDDFILPDGTKREGLKEKFLAFFKHEPQWYWQHYKFELCYVLFFVLVFIRFQAGKSQNDQIATAWRKNIVPIIFNEFPHMGCGDDPRNFAIMQKTYADYDYFASGKKHCKFAEFHLNLIRRHCVLTEYIYDMYSGNVDRLVIDIALDLGTRETPIEMYICRRKDLKQKMKAIEHLGEFVKNSNAKNYRLNDEESSNKNSLVIMSEHDEIANQIIDDKVGDTLKKYGSSGLLHEIHITDQKFYNQMPLFMRVVIQVPDVDDADKNTEFNQLFNMSLHIIDLVAATKLSATVASKCEKARKKAKQAEAKIKKEESDNKKAEESRAKEAIERDRLKRMSPAEQAKYEEKQKKKENQKMKSKFMKVMK